MSIFDQFRDVADSVHALSEHGVMPFGTVLEDVSSPTAGVVDGHPVLLAGTNNYLGLTFDSECIEAAGRALLEQGTGTTGSRLANGSYVGHLALEQELVDFYATASAIVFSTGFLATMGMVSTLIGPEDTILIDADCHASIYEGARVSGADVIRFRHNNPDDLEQRLRRLGDRAGSALIVVEGIYSMLGDQAPLAEIVALKHRYGGYLMVDEAHSLGVLGATGRGLAQEAGVEDAVDFIVGTFSKSLGSVGGFCTSRHSELELLRYKARAYVFTASLTPSVIASTRVALSTLQSGHGLRERLWNNVHRLYRTLAQAGFELGPHPGPVISIAVDSRDKALAWWRHLLKQGVYVNLVLPPATPTGGCLLRCSLSAAHTEADVDRIAQALCALPGFRPAAEAP